jgi:hypothetical protein
LRAALSKSSDAQARLFADHLFRLTDAQFPAQIADAEAAIHLVVLIQIVRVEPFKNSKPKFAFLPGGGCSGVAGKGLRTTRLDKFGYVLR